MMGARRESGHLRPRSGLVGHLRGRLPYVIIFGCLILLNWSTAGWLLHDTYQEKSATASRQVETEARLAEVRFAAVFHDADRMLLDARARFQRDGTRSDPAHLSDAPVPGGIALIAPDGRVMAASPNAGIAGWPHLMARLAASGDKMAIGEPILDKPGHLGLLPVARQLVAADGSFAGIVMLSLESAAFPGLPPALEPIEGCISLVDDDGVILSRTPDLRGTAGIRLPEIAWLHEGAARSGRHASPIDGVERIFAYRHLAGFPMTVVVGVGADATFADWRNLLFIVFGTRLIATVLILLGGWFWYSRWTRAKVSANALAAILAGTEQAIRVENVEGAVIVANSAGEALSMPDSDGTEAETVAADGTVLRVTRHDLADGGKMLIGSDVTARRAAEARIAFLTTHDQLTGLPNRWLAMSQIAERIAERSNPGRTAALILVDLDGFKDINDTLGHDGGDEVLTEVAARAGDLVSGRDVVACLGGDEFLLFLDDRDDEAAVLALTAQVSRALARPIGVRGQQVRLGASMGIALCPRDGSDAATLIRHADIALGRAKLAGRGTAQVFDRGMMVSFEEHRMMESDLRRALDGDELELVLQPQFSCESLEVTGFEALTRWRHPTRGALPPAAFIPVAERSGLIYPLGLWAIEQACAAAAAWRTRHRVAVNLSPSQLRGEAIQDDIRAILRRTQSPRTCWNWR